MARRELKSYRWNGTEWTSVPESFCSTYERPSSDEPIRIATFNVLADCFPWFVEMAIRSPERLEWLCDGIRNLNPTVLGLNELTMNALQRLQECPFIRENYFLTARSNQTEDENQTQMENFSESKVLFPHQCVIMSKLPLAEVFTIPVSGRKREAIAIKVQIGQTEDTSVYICSHHATPYQSIKNAQLRAQQIRDIMNVLVPLNHPFIIMGDLNLYHEFEDAVVIDNQLIDAWAQTHFSNEDPFNDKNLGYTFDSIKNTLIPYYIPGSCAKMRLDRILFSNRFPAFAKAPCRLWADEPIKADNYLFPSDHFGLSIDIFLENASHPREPGIVKMSLGIADPAAEETLRRNAQNTNDERRDRVGIVRKTKAWTSHVFWLGGRALGLK